VAREEGFRASDERSQLVQSKGHIRRLLRELNLPESADQVVQRPKYWTPDFCWLFFDRCDELIFDDPQEGLGAAEVAPELASLVSKFSRDAGSHASLSLRALGVLASAYRAVGDLEQAEETYLEALALTRTERLSEVDVANLFFRISVLRSFQNRLDEALGFATDSVQIYRRSNRASREQHLGEALTIRGYAYFQSENYAAAMKDWSEALSCTDPKKRPRVYHSATHNLACGLVANTVDPRSLSAIERCLRQARKFLSKRPRSLLKLRLIWLEGMIMIRFGSTRRGEAALMSARRSFIEMEAPFDMALVSLTLGKYLSQTKQFEELRALANETQKLFSVFCADRQANRALALWKEGVAARAFSARGFETAWQAVQRRGAVAAQGKPHLV